MVSSFLVNNYHLLKKQEAWQEIISQGSLSLKNDKLTIEDRFKISTILASTNHYLGDYQLAALNAKNAWQFSTDINEKAKSAYLVSACYRNLSALAKKNSEQAKFKNESFCWIVSALDLCLKINLDNEIRGKVYFNAAALYHDLKIDSYDAESYYILALDYFQKNSESHNRTLIRFSRFYLEHGNIDKAKQIKNQIQVMHLGDIDGRVHIQFELVNIKILFAEQKYDQAQKLLESSMSFAEQKGMWNELNEMSRIKHDLTYSPSFNIEPNYVIAVENIGKSK